MSKIEWTDATWNPVTGCSKVSQGCKHCYAERLFPRVYGRDIVEYRDTVAGDPHVTRQRRFTDVKCHPDRLDHPLRWRKPRMVFVNSMSDLFHADVPDQFIADVLVSMGAAAQHTYQVLTKRPERMRDGLRAYYDGAPPLSCLWLGVSVEDQATADERIPILLDTPAAVRFVSYEPALGPVDFRKTALFDDPKYRFLPNMRNPLVGGGQKTDTPWRVNWVIAGGESGPNARPAHPEWFRSVRDQCQEAGVPFFFKQWGEWAPQTHLTQHGRSQIVSADCGQFIHHQPMYRVGKKAAGRELDCRTWDEIPPRIEKARKEASGE